MGEQIVLDRDVRDWVLVPLTMSIVLMMLIRQYATQVRMIAVLSLGRSTSIFEER